MDALGAGLGDLPYTPLVEQRLLRGTNGSAFSKLEKAKHRVEFSNFVYMHVILPRAHLNGC